MKAWHPIFFVLFAVAAGEALPPDAVPVMCAAICGPIVELSSMCSPKRSLGNIGSNRLDREAHPKQARKHDGERVEESEKIEKRFSVIVPAPTTFPPDLLVDQYPLASPPMSETSVLPSQSPAPIPPPTYSPPAQPPPVSALPTTADNLPWSNAQAGPPSPTPSTTSNIHSSVSSVGTKTGTKPPTTSSHHTSTTPTIIGSNGKDGDETRGWGETENAEEECVCLNHSFNVAEIAGLCASCISMIADTQNDMEVIMSVCDFPSQQYSPDKDSLASNIWVKAARPTAGSTLNGASGSNRLASVASIIGAVSFTIGALMML